MRVTHIYHSGFAVELKGCNLLFDWYTGELPPLRRDVPLVVFVSHEHSDHYGRCIWRLPNSFSDVRYVVDSAVAEQAPQGRDVLSVESEGDYCIDLGTDAGTMEVRTLESNDEGVAFLVRACGKTVYFSGDLNVWWWNRPKAQNEASERFFRGELERIADADVDAAFVPWTHGSRTPSPASRRTWTSWARTTCSPCTTGTMRRTPRSACPIPASPPTRRGSL